MEIIITHPQEDNHYNSEISADLVAKKSQLAFFIWGLGVGYIKLFLRP